jgi:hypothetical protein
MTSGDNDMSTFETALLNELRTIVTERGEQRPRHPLARRLRRPSFIAVPVGVAGAAAAAVVGLGALSGATAAYAVTTASSGDVVVTINSLSDASGLQSALRAEGIDATVNYDANGSLTPPVPAGSGAVDGGSSASGRAPAGTGSAPVISQSSHQSSGSASGPSGTGSSTSTGDPAPVGIHLSGNGPDTITIPASDVNNGYVLHITTSGSAASGLAALQFDWTN